MGAIVAGGVAVAVSPNTPPTKVCVDNRTKALFASTDGSCAKTRTLMEIAGKGADVETIASAYRLLLYLSRFRPSKVVDLALE